MIKLLGLLIVAVGFALRLNALAVVVAAGLVTGLLAGLSFEEILAMTGKFFVENRQLVLPVILMLPAVGLLEKHGLRERVAQLMRRATAATAGRILWLYQAVRGLTSMVGISVGNHASMVRPLVAPMAESAGISASPAEAAGLAAPRAEAAGLPAPQAENATDPKILHDMTASHQIRAHAAAAENVGNFFSDDIVVAVGALLLLHSTLTVAGVEVTMRELKLWSLPTALWVLGVGWWRYRRLDARLKAMQARPDRNKGRAP